MPGIHEIEVFILIDENGDYAINKDQTELQSSYVEDIGENFGELATRIIAVKLKVPSPTIITVEAVLPAQPSEVIVSVK